MRIYFEFAEFQLRILLEFIPKYVVVRYILYCALRLVVSSSKKYVVIMQSITIEKYAGCKGISYAAHYDSKLIMKSQLYVWQYVNKGQLISKGLFDVIVWTKKPTKYLQGFLP